MLFPVENEVLRGLQDNGRFMALMYRHLLEFITLCYLIVVGMIAAG